MFVRANKIFVQLKLFEKKLPEKISLRVIVGFINLTLFSVIFMRRGLTWETICGNCATYGMVFVDA